VKDSDLQPEIVPADQFIEHNPTLSPVSLTLQQKEDRYMIGAKKVESPTKLQGETRLQYAQRKAEFFKHGWMKEQLSPDGARAAGLLPHRRESMVPGEEFQEEAKPVKRKRTKHPVSGVIDLDTMLATHLAEQASQQSRDALRVAQAAAEAPIMAALTAVALLQPGDNVTVIKMREYCKLNGITVPSGLSRASLLAHIGAYILKQSF